MEELKRNPMYRYLMVLVICASAGLQGWTALNWRLPFLVGTAFSLLSLWFTQKIRTSYHVRKVKASRN